MLIGKQVDGIIAVPPPGGDDTVAYIKEMGVPVVTVDRPGAGVDFVGIDNYASSRSAVEGLLQDGFRSISLVALDLDIDPLNQRRDAYVDAMKERGLGDKIDIRLIPFGREEEYDIPSILKGLRNVDAVYFTSRRAFTQGMAHLALTGQILPEDQCLLCFDDVQPYLTVHSNIRYVEQPVGEMAGKAFDLLMEQIRGERIPGRYIFPTRCISNRKY